MLAHFGHWAVWVSYGIVILASLFGFEYLSATHMLVLAGAGMGVALVIIDHTVHRSIHGWKPLAFPWPSVLWVGGLVVMLLADLIVMRWQLVGIYLAQAVWDNSWHAAVHHRENGEPRAELDYPFIRWGVLVVAVLVVMLPDFLRRI